MVAGLVKQPVFFWKTCATLLTAALTISYLYCVLNVQMDNFVQSNGDVLPENTTSGDENGTLDTTWFQNFFSQQ